MQQSRNLNGVLQHASATVVVSLVRPFPAQWLACGGPTAGLVRLKTPIRVGRDGTHDSCTSIAYARPLPVRSCENNHRGRQVGPVTQTDASDRDHSPAKVRGGLGPERWRPPKA